MKKIKTANDASRQQVIASCLLAAYYDGKADQAASRVFGDGQGQTGLENLPDDERMLDLLNEPQDEERLRRAMSLARSVLLFTDAGT